MSTLRAATLLGPERLEIREYPVPEVADDGALLRIGVGGVCGIDVKYFRGRIRIVDPVRRLYGVDLSEPERWSRICDVLAAALADPELKAAAQRLPTARQAGDVPQHPL